MQLDNYFSKEEIAGFCRRSDAAAWFCVLVNWGMIAGSFALVAVWPNPMTILLAILLLGGRQLGLGVLMHECGHGTLFRSRWLNRLVGQWLAAGPIAFRLDDYMQRHLAHHAKAGSEQDPDLSRYRRYPVERAALTRKLLRDVSGHTAWNFLRANLQTANVFEAGDNGPRLNLGKLLLHFRSTLLSNGLMIALLAWFGHVELYLLWLAAFFSTYMLFSRIRNLAEHAVVPDLFDPDPIRHTRTTLARWWERLTVAPNSVNYHLEHHLLPAVPRYRLEHFHTSLREKGLLANAEIVKGYPQFIRRLVAPEAANS